MAEGGKLEDFCASDRKHLPECEYYIRHMADGGNVEMSQDEIARQHGAEMAKLHHDNQARHAEFMKRHLEMMAPKPQPNTGLTASHAVAHKGLLSVLKDTGNSSLMDPDKYHKVINDAKDHHAARIQDSEIQRPKSLSGKIGHSLAGQDHDRASDALQGHPLAGLVGKSHLKSILGELGGPMMALESNPKALRGSVDYLHNSLRGEDTLNKNVKSLLDPKHKIEVPEHHVDQLKSYVNDMVSNPDALLNSGGDLGHYLPSHGASVAALSATAVNYLNSIKPLNQQTAPLDPVMKPSKSAMADYDRQVAITQNPMLVLQHAKEGRLLPADIATLTTVYPHLKEAIVSKVGEQMINIKDDEKDIPYSMRSSLSMLLGQPLDGTMSQSAMQAIMGAQLPKNSKTQPSQVAPAGGKSTGMTETAYKADKEVEKMVETPLQARQINRNRS